MKAVSVARAFREMKFHIFAFVIAFILEDYGTFQETPVSRCSNVQLVALFKKYALGLVKEAAGPLSKNKVLLEGAYECLSDIDVNEFVNPMDAILATTLIAKDDHKILTTIEKTDESNLSTIMGKIGNGLLANVRLILVFLQTSGDRAKLVSGTKMYKKYLKHNQGPSTSAAGITDGNSKPRLKCYRILEGADENEDFLNKLDDGFELLRQLMTAHNDGDTKDPRWDEVAHITRDIRGYKLETPPPRTREELKTLLHRIDVYGEDLDAEF